MARDALIEARLQRWAQAVTVGDGSGYPAMSVLHPDWSPPAPGTTPTMKSAPASDVVATHRALQALRRESQRLANTVIVHYCLRLSCAEQAERLGCTPGAIDKRIERVHWFVRRMVDDGWF